METEKAETFIFSRLTWRKWPQQILHFAYPTCANARAGPQTRSVQDDTFCGEGLVWVAARS